MKVLILGASGATGKQVVMQMIKRGISTRIVVRESAHLPQEIIDASNVEIIKGNITEFESQKLKELVKDCAAVVSCLGHNITFKGMFGKPRLLVYSAVKRICEAIEESGSRKVKLVLMSTTAFTNRYIGEKNTIGERIVFSLLKVLLPPHLDNMKSADYLITKIGKDNAKIEWTAVRPDGLINEDAVSGYSISEFILRSPISNPGQTSRINVGHFMAELLTDNKLWDKWKYKTPVIYNEKQKEK